MLLHSFIFSLALSGSAIAGKPSSSSSDLPTMIPVKYMYRVDLRPPKLIKKYCDDFICRDQLKDTPETPYGISFTSRFSADKFLKNNFPLASIHIYIIELLDDDPNDKDFRPHMVAAEAEAVAYLRNPKAREPLSKTEFPPDGKFRTHAEDKKMVAAMKKAISTGLRGIPSDTIASKKDQQRVLESPWRKVEGWVVPKNYEHPMIHWSRDFVAYNPGPQVISGVCRFFENCGRKAVGKQPKPAPVPLIPMTDTVVSPSARRIAPAQGSSILRDDYWLYPAT